MELMDVIKKRQSVRKYKAGDIPNTDVELMIEAARLAPSGKNAQNWHFIAIKNDRVKKRIAEAVQGKNERIAQELDKVSASEGENFRKFIKHFTLFFLNAPLLIVVMTTDYLPTGYQQLKMIDADQTVLDSLVYKASPGMQSLGAAIEHILLRAVDLGYGACWLTSANYASQEVAAVLREEPGFSKDGYFLGALLSVGIPEDGAKSPPRRDLSDIYTLVE